MIMDQETSKKFFICSGKQKYDFILEACGLKRIYDDIEDATENINEAKRSLRIVEQEVKRLASDVTAKDRTTTVMTGLQRQVEQIALLAVEMEWAKISDAQRALDLSSLDIDKAKEKLRLSEVAGEKFRIQLEEDEKIASKHVESIENANIAMEAVLNEVNMKKDAVHEARIALSSTRSTHETFKKNFAKATKGVQDAEASLEAFLNDSSGTAKDLKTAWTKDCENARKKLIQIEKQLKEKKLLEKETTEKSAAANASYKVAQNEALFENNRARDADEKYNTVKAQIQVREELIQKRRNEFDNREKGASSSLKTMLDQRLSGLHSNQNNSRIKNVLEAVKKVDAQITRFKVPPIVPLIRSLRVDKKWHRTLEAHFLNELLMFIVADSADAKLLESIVGSGVSYVVLPMTRRYADDTSQPREWRGHRLIDVIETDSDWAYNFLLDRNFDRILVGEEEKDLLKLMQLNQITCKWGFTEKAVRLELRYNGSGLVSKKPDYDFFNFSLCQERLPSSSTSSQSFSDLSEELTLAKIESLEALDRECIDKLKSELLEMKAKKDSCTRAKTIADDKLKDATAFQGRIASSLVHLKGQVIDLEQQFEKAHNACSTLESNEPIDDEDFNSERAQKRAELESNLEEKKKILQEITSLLEKAAADESNAIMKKDSLESELDALAKNGTDNILTKLKKAADDANDKVLKTRLQIEKLHAFSEKHKALLDEKVKEFEAERLNIERRRLNLVKDSGKEGPIDSTLTEKQAEANYLAAKNQYEADSIRYNVDGAAIEAAIHAAAAAKSLYDDKQNQYNELRTSIEKLKVIKIKLKERFSRGKKTIAAKITREFRERMRKNGFQADIKFKHAADLDTEEVAKKGEEAINHRECEGEVIILISPDALQRFGATAVGRSDSTSQMPDSLIPMQDVATLSGGEKSVSTLHLLSAIMKFAALPFRAIDEFDVFQDEKNRQRSLKSLLEQSKEKNEDGRQPQMILLTPHDISAVVDPTNRPDISVIRLANPRVGVLRTTASTTSSETNDTTQTESEE
jgi:structural maintenance of chromosomes protein 6